jgi:hypothetical protein
MSGVWRPPRCAWDDSRVIHAGNLTEYACSRCDTTATIPITAAGSPMHTCAGAGGMTVPLALAGKSSKVELVERQDYVGDDDVQRDDEGRVWMSVVVTTDEQESVAVYAPCAHAKIG